MSALPGSIRRALAIEPSVRAGSIADVDHIVILMQENRSFDHYLGHLSGVRGFGDRFPITLPGGRPVWFQPGGASATGTVAPFRLDTTNSEVNAQCIGGLPHTWASTHGAINGGAMDRWVARKTDMTMGFYVREDLPFHYALADAFTVCDQYFCSIPGNTHPNRMYLMTGMVDPTGAGGGPLLDNVDWVDNQFDAVRRQPFTWTTYPERLEAAGIDWRIYQQGTDFDDFSGNFGTNVLANFRNFTDAAPDSALHRRAMVARTLDQLREDVRAGALPQVSWLLPPAAFSEHPRWTPMYGASYVSQVLEALTSNPRSWARTALFVTYDENDGFFDHVVPPQPPTVPGSGASTVDIAAERHTVVPHDQAGVYRADLLPYGLGPRVPMTVVSPWTRGGFVCSQVFDHTSLIRFIETRFGVAEPNISPWRRAVCGDMTSAFDFSRPHTTLPSLPSTAAYRRAADLQCSRSATAAAPREPHDDTLPTQEPGVRRARPLPYDLHVSARIDDDRCKLTFGVAGSQAAVFWVYGQSPEVSPRTYTVGVGEELSDVWALDELGGYAVEVHGPNGFFRRIAETSSRKSQASADIEARADAAAESLRLEFRADEASSATFVVRDLAYGLPRRTATVRAREHRDMCWQLSASQGWYDLEITMAERPGFLRRLAGHVESGRPTTTDPAGQSGSVIRQANLGDTRNDPF